MSDRAALKLALELLYVPWRIRLVREQPLPEGMDLLLRVAAGDPESETAAVEAAGRPPEVVRQAATFFIEQILLAPDAYRVLGTGPAATTGELRQHMALLMRWLHPDVAREGEQAVFAARIATAWNNLKTPDRRTAYDNARQNAEILGNRHPEGGRSSREARGESTRSPHRSRSGRSRRVPASGEPGAGALPRVLAFLFGRRRH
jgi:hypothetical protein